MKWFGSCGVVVVVKYWLWKKLMIVSLWLLFGGERCDKVVWWVL